MASTRTDDGLLLVLLVLGVLLLVPVLIMAFAMPMMGMMGWWAGGGAMDGYAPLWGLGTLLVSVVVLIAVGYAVYRAVAARTPSGDADPAMEELRMAYARGDLTEEEFEQRRRDLRRSE